MDTLLLTLGPGAGVAIGLAIHAARQRRFAATMSETILTELAKSDSLSLPELVTHVGLRDGFFNRGKLIDVLNPMVRAGEILQEEPPGTTMKSRLASLRYRLAPAFRG